MLDKTIIIRVSRIVNAFRVVFDKLIHMDNVFNIRLKEIRLEYKLSQKQTAEKLKISVSCYAGYEQGYRQPDLKMLTKICVLFDVSADYLLGLED